MAAVFKWETLEGRWGVFQVVHSIGRSVSETSFINSTGNVAVANKLYILFVSGIILTLCVCVGIDLLLFSLSLVIFSFLRHGWISHSHGQVVALSQGGRIFYYLLTGPYAWNLISSTKVRRTIRFSDR